MSRVASRLRSAFSLNLPTDGLPNRVKRLRRNRVLRAFAVHHEQIDHAIRQAVVVDHPYTAALTSAGTRPANLSTTARTLDDIANLGVQCQPRYKLTAFVLRPIIQPQASEGGSFDDRVQEIIRLSRIYVKDVVKA
jgi:hypothetical protein